MSIAGPPSALPLRALVIEDDPSIPEIYRQVLKPLGIDVTVSSNGAKGAELFAAEHFDLLIVDYLLPGMDGLKVLEKTSLHRRVPTVVASALLKDRAIMLRMKALGAQWFISKPFKLPELKQILEDAVKVVRSQTS